MIEEPAIRGVLAAAISAGMLISYASAYLLLWRHARRALRGGSWKHALQQPLRHAAGAAAWTLAAALVTTAAAASLLIAIVVYRLSDSHRPFG